MKLALSACILLGSLAASTVANAQEETLPEIVGVRVGFAGLYKVGYWTPVEVTVRAGSLAATGGLEIRVADGDGIDCITSTPPNRPLQAAAGQLGRATLYVRCGRIDGALRITFHRDAGRAVRRTVNPGEQVDGVQMKLGLATDESLYVMLDPDIGLGEIGARQGAEKAETHHVARLQDARELPGRWYGYEGVNAVVFATSQPEIYDPLTSNSAPLHALAEWVEQGGKLIVCAGDEAARVFSPDAPLEMFAPGKFMDVELVRRAAPFESLAGVPFPDFSNSPAGQRGVPVPRFDGIAGRVEAREGDLPLVVRTARIFGEVAFVGADLDRRPFAGWPGRERILSGLLRQAGEGSEVVERRRIFDPQSANLGLSDLSGQLQAALDQFVGVRLIPFWQVGMLVVLYILVIGPGDYFLLKRVFKRMEMTWITFPVMVVAFSLLGYVLAYAAKGRQLRVNRAEIVDVDVESGQVRGASWTTVFSPQSDTYDLSFEPRLPTGEPAQQPDVLLSWLGLPGTALGSMQPSAASPRLFSRAYAFSPELDRMSGAPIHVWSTKSFTARWKSSTRPKETVPQVTADLQEDRLRMAFGTLTNGLDVPLQGCVLAYGDSGWSLGDLAAGSTMTVDPTRQLQLVDLLQDTRLIREKRDVLNTDAAHYNQAGLDGAVILQQMMFYEASGGQAYTGLSNSYQSFADLSGHLALGKAILTGRAPAAEGSRLLDYGEPLASDQDRKWIVYRFVFPVTPATEPAPVAE